MKKLWTIGLAVCMGGAGCQSASNFTPSVDTASQASGSTAAVPALAEGQQSLPASSMVVNGRSITDPEFFMETASNSLMQVSLGRMAQEKATHPEVKKFAQMMIDHHSKAYTEMKAIAAEVSINLPMTLLPMHQAMVDKLSKLTGKDFDEEYMEEMEEMHEKDVTLYEVASNGAQTIRVKAYAIRTLPQLRTHLFEADRVEDLVD